MVDPPMISSHPFHEVRACKSQVKMATTNNKGFIDETDVCKIFQRYSPTIILSLLQEVHRYSSKKIDWSTLVQKSTTGISNAREYQMLWRHLAYRYPLLEKLELEAGTQPLDDDSDLEFQLEAVPSVSAEASREAAASVKVLSSSGLPSYSSPPNRLLVDAPKAINTSIGETSASSSDEQQIVVPNCRTNTTVPTYFRKRSQPSDGLDGNPSAASAQPPKKRRKVWTKQEDEELISAVQKYGEGNWANILKGEFKLDRTAPQISQRWSTIKKRIGISTVGGGNTAASSTQSEQVLVATRKAVSMALNMPNLGSFTKTNSVTPASTSSAAPVNTSTFPLDRAPAPQQVSNRATNQKEASVSSSSNISQITVKKLSSSVNPSICPIQAAAFAAGGRIATPLTAASLFKAAQSRGAIHIRPCSSALPKPTATPAKFSPPATTAGVQLQSRQTGPAGKSLPYAGAKLGNCHVQGSSDMCMTYLTTICCTRTSRESTESKNDIPNTKVDDLIEFDEMVARERLSREYCAESSGITDFGMKRNGVSSQKDPIYNTLTTVYGAKTQSGVACNPASKSCDINVVLEKRTAS